MDYRFPRLQKPDLENSGSYDLDPQKAQFNYFSQLKYHKWINYFCCEPREVVKQNQIISGTKSLTSVLLVPCGSLGNHPKFPDCMFSLIGRKRQCG